jgi:hypothetical protein
MDQRRPRLPEGPEPRCPVCSALDLTYHIKTQELPIPIGATGFISCGFCKTWWEVQATYEAESIFAPEAWQVIDFGLGWYGPRVKDRPAGND